MGKKGDLPNIQNSDNSKLPKVEKLILHQTAEWHNPVYAKLPKNTFLVQNELNKNIFNFNYLGNIIIHGIK